MGAWKAKTHEPFDIIVECDLDVTVLVSYHGRQALGGAWDRSVYCIAHNLLLSERLVFHDSPA
jgi:hypothetical protein